MLSALPIPSALSSIHSFERNSVKRPAMPFWKSASFTEYADPLVIRPQTQSCDSGSDAKLLPLSDNSVHNLRDKPQSTYVERSAGPLSNELRDWLMGKSPLRLVMRREPVFPTPGSKLEWNQAYGKPTHWVETLECGHSVGKLFDLGFYGGETFSVIPNAKRRRCQECKEIQLAAKYLPPKKPAQSVRPDSLRKEESL